LIQVKSQSALDATVIGIGMVSFSEVMLIGELAIKTSIRLMLV